MQVTAGRHYIIENPRGSDLFTLTVMKTLLRTGVVKVATFPQCALGLQSPEGLPLLKWTTLWASSEVLLRRFRGLQCNCEVHGKMEGGYCGQRRSKLAQVWPYEMCKLIVAGLIELLAKLSSFPVGEDGAPEKRRPGRPRLHEVGAEFKCPACRISRVSTDPGHTRSLDAEDRCRYPGVEPIEWRCPACAAGKGPMEDGHSMVKGECRALETRTRAFGKRRDAQSRIRDPAIPASGDASRR